MKKVFIASLMAASLAPVFAHAADGTLQFNGNVAATTCQLSAGPGGTLAFTMADARVDSLSKQGDHFKGGNFNVNLVKCGGTARTVQLGFDANLVGINATSGRMLNTGSATNVEVALRATDADLTDLKLGTGNARSATVTSVVTGTGATADSTAVVPLIAYYVATADGVTAGTVKSQVQFNIYQP
ncbi:type 1 fimbrial protein [Herbaspirillum sp. LeCh32-8]|uniref:fimbrial protein n=1 Tax=Herbaspirillum sp. LeCh32-8 TaxID=2821356 RepID=UPI001AE229CC|nr:fimbrial protein [Herbaspirillum sp. LeCh32-8]MBP0597935.1 type 1 fimbrial protein [Herbaspirillum sp. LeCh32-8]